MHEIFTSGKINAMVITNNFNAMILPETCFQTIASLINRATIETKRKEYTKALAMYKKAENSFPQPAESYTGACFLFLTIGELLLLMERKEEAFQYFTKANDCADGRSDAKICCQLGLMHLHNGDLAEAKRQLAKAYTLDGETKLTLELNNEMALFVPNIFQTA